MNALRGIVKAGAGSTAMNEFLTGSVKDFIKRLNTEIVPLLVQTIAELSPVAIKTNLSAAAQKIEAELAVMSRALIDAGEIGDLRHVEAMFCFNNADPADIRNQADLGGGALRDIGVYVIGSARFATGQEPQEVAARIRWENGFDVHSQISARFDGFTYTATVSTRLNLYQQMTFHGDRGSINLTAPFNGPVFGDATVIVRKAGAPETVHRFNAARQYDLQVAAFNRAVLDGTPYPCPLEFSRGTQAMIDAAFANADTLPQLTQL
jgi:predicted dehydrogenase